VSKAGLRQNVLLKSQLPHPSEWGLNPAATRLQVLTEFYDAPEPQKEMAIRGGGFADELLDFGAMKMARDGKAFSLDVEGGTGEPVRVYKQWGELEGRTFLVEEVPFATSP
jgi:hypothetical protein